MKTHPGLGHGHWPLRGPDERRRPSRPESEWHPGPCSRGGRSWPGQPPEERGEPSLCAHSVLDEVDTAAGEEERKRLGSSVIGSELPSPLRG